ncbi:MAG TPA: hypothetical protein G4O02_04430 [Caldilineae bacterium]|nr:hypothetical protein [Caldilineae bacterium]
MVRRGGWLLAFVFLSLAIAGDVYAQPPIPTIPHSLEGRAACLACHEAGVGGAPVIPANHTGRTNEMCTTCHVAASEAPPQPPLIPHTLVGRSDCLFCHEKGVGGATVIPSDHAGRTSETCRNCHQPGAPIEAPPTPAGPPTPTPVPIPTPIVHPVRRGQNTCATCHRTLDEKQARIVDEWEKSIHAARNVSCADCHGGDPGAEGINESMAPAAGYIGVPDRVKVPGLCASCHADPVRMRQYDLPTDQFAKYQESIHGRALYENGDPNVATCVDCHGSHKVPEVNDPSADVYPINVPKLCARCHADEQLMAPYAIATNQYDLYRKSVHGIALLERQDLRAPSCATCHGTHGAAPPGFAEVANVCGSCHSATQDYYARGAHAQAGDAGPKCVTCHGRYDVTKPDESLFVGTEERHCGNCHPPDSPIGKEVAQIREAILEAAATLAKAEELVSQAASRGMIVAYEETKLSEARTGLISARAAQHQVALDVVTKLTEASVAASQEVMEAAEQKLRESVFRRQAMVVAVVAISITVGALYSIKRELDRRLEP